MNVSASDILHSLKIGAVIGGLCASRTVLSHFVNVNVGKMADSSSHSLEEGSAMEKPPYWSVCNIFGMRS